MFFFKQKTAYEMRISDWSSDVCSSDLPCRVEAKLFAERQALAHRLVDPGNQNLIDRLGGLAGTALAHQGDACGITRQRRHRLVEIGLCAADHHRQLTVARPFNAPGNRRVEKTGRGAGEGKGVK